jgi:hypothetical protein
MTSADRHCVRNDHHGENQGCCEYTDAERRCPNQGLQPANSGYEKKRPQNPYMTDGMPAKARSQF